MANNVEAAYPLAPLQEGLLFHTLSRPGEPTYFEQIRCTITGELDLAAFERSWNWLTARHSVLRSAFAWKQLKRPVQVVARSATVPFDWADWRDRDDPERDWQDLLARDRDQGFDLARAPLMRLILRRVDEDTTYFVWSHHHILLDGWSFGIVLHELLECYASLVDEGEPISLTPARPFGDFIRYLGERDEEEDARFWREYLRGFTTPTRLAVDRGQGVHEGGSGVETTLTVSLDRETSAAVLEQCGRLGVSISALAHGAWARLLGAYSGEDEVLFGSTTAGRPPELPGVEGMVGLFINAVPLRVQVDPRRVVGEWLTDLQRDLFRLQAHQFTGLAGVQELSEVERGKPLFETLLAFQNYPLDDGHVQDWAGIRLTDYGWTGPTNYPVAVRVFPGEEIMLVLTYYRHRLDDDVAENMLDQFRLLVERLGTEPDRRLWEAEVVAGAHADRALRAWNDTETPIDHDRTLHGLVERHAATRPDATAVVGVDGRLTFRELDERANQVAHSLVVLGVRPGDRVGLCTQKCAANVVAILGVLKAGAAYLPIDPAYPADRIAFMIEDARLSALLTWGRGTEATRDADLPRLALDSDWPSVASRPSSPPAVTVSPDDFAYLIYTSGSSGQPKGVLLNHRGRVNNLEDYCRLGDMGPQDRTLCVSSLSFDISVGDVFMTLNAGGRVVYPDPDREKDPEHWLDLVEREGISLWRSAPAVMDALLDAAAGRPYRADTLRVVMLDGDWIPLTQPDRIRSAFPNARIISGGGATELSLNSTVFPVGKVDPAWRSIPYGRPLANQTAYILDHHGQLAPVGVPGELLLGGIGMGAGYWRRPELTAEKFVPHPWPTRPGERLYRTGDLAKYGPDGLIELIGRLDFQVKIRGLRIELGEIEAALGEHPKVSACVVGAPADHEGDRRLVGYVVPSAAGKSDVDDSLAAELRAWLRQRMPEHQVPEAFVRLASIPLTANGKVNRRDLPVPRFATATPDRAAPATELEATLAEHWAGVLGLDVDDVDVETSFFDLGGNSLKALRACRVPGVSVPITALYQYRTVRALAEHIGGGAAEGGVLVRLTGSDPAPAVICVPYGGGHAGVYQPLADALGDRLALYAVRLPGHEHDDTGAPQPIETVAQAVVTAARELAGRPLLVYGHCGGVALATEIARRLETDGADVRGLFVAASYPPATAAALDDDPLATVDDVELAKQFAKLGAFEDLTDEEAATIGALLRFDGDQARRYFRQALVRDDRLRTPLHCLIGTGDPLTTDYVDGWRNWARLATEIRLVEIPAGDHYFLRGQCAEVAGHLATTMGVAK